VQNENDDNDEFCCNHRLCVAMSIGAILVAACVIPLTAVFGFMNVASLAAVGSVAGMLSADFCDNKYLHLYQALSPHGYSLSYIAAPLAGCATHYNYLQ
jgi:hypothetical protein